MTTLAAVHEGSLRIRLWRSWVRVKEKRYCRFEFIDPTTGRRVKRSGLEAARAAARKAARLLLSRGIELLGTDAQSYANALDALVGSGLTLEQAARLAAATRAAELAGKDALHVEQAIARLLEQRQADGLSARHMRDLRQRLDRFGKQFRGPLADLQPELVDCWLRDLQSPQGAALSARSRANYRGAVSNLVGWAKSQRLLPSFALEAVARPKVPKPDPQVFTPEELRWLLAGAPPSMLPLLVLGAFAGLRQSEILALDWSAIGDDHVIVPSCGKTGRRIVPMLPNLGEWLAPLRRRSGRVVALTMGGVSKGIVRTVDKANRLLQVEGQRPLASWRHNGLRHSFVSYRMAIVRDAGPVSEETGHSVAMLKRSYQQVVTPDAARVWFAIYPEAVPGVVQLSLFAIPNLSPTHDQPRKSQAKW